MPIWYFEGVRKKSVQYLYIQALENPGFTVNKRRNIVSAIHFPTNYLAIVVPSTSLGNRRYMRIISIINPDQENFNKYLCPSYISNGINVNSSGTNGKCGSILYMYVPVISQNQFDEYLVSMQANRKESSTEKRQSIPAKRLCNTVDLGKINVVKLEDHTEKFKELFQIIEEQERYIAQMELNYNKTIQELEKKNPRRISEMDKKKKKKMKITISK